MAKITIEQAVQKIAILKDQIEQKFLKIGEYLLVLNETMTIKQIEARTGIKARTAANLIVVAKAVRDGTLTKASVLQLGYTKSAIVAPAVAKGRVSLKLLEKAGGMSSMALQKAVKAPADEERNPFNFMLTEKEKDALEAALVEFGAVRHGLGLRGKDNALMTILVKAQSAVARKKAA